MAIMIPEIPHEFDPYSQEGLMFDALSQLPDDYYVFHSFRITDVSSNTFHESETDFVVLNRNRGVICLEAKAGQVRYENGNWLYGNGIPMYNGGPFNQASTNKYKLMKYISKGGMAGILEKCKFLHGVWFPSIPEEKLKTMILPSEGDKALVLTKEALLDPERYLERIYSIELTSKVETKITEIEFKRLIREVLCPEFNILPAASFESDLKKIVFHRLLKEQSAILNFLEGQRTAAINGSAGTGKTMIATEKALRNASDGESVLFLCFNSQLKEHLEKNYPHKLISYFTIAGFACKLCGTSKPDYEKAKSILEDYYISGSFPYKHVIIDEGQDFGNESIEEADIIQLMHDIVVEDDRIGTFYVFYDRFQLIQARAMPKFIGELDCKLTLYRNCRNTENIASTSMRPITEIKPKLFEGAVKGAPAKFHFCNDSLAVGNRIDYVINSLLSDGFKDIIILTCKTENNSLISDLIKDGKYRSKYLFTTCRKFKGLEADAVILVDVDKALFDQENVLLYYVGTSRARLKLDIIAILTDEECINILNDSLHFNGKIKKPKKDLASALNTVGSQS